MTALKIWLALGTDRAVEPSNCGFGSLGAPEMSDVAETPATPPAERAESSGNSSGAAKEVAIRRPIPSEERRASLGVSATADQTYATQFCAGAVRAGSSEPDWLTEREAPRLSGGPP